jgi:hypothetical protein
MSQTKKLCRFLYDKIFRRLLPLLTIDAIRLRRCSPAQNLVELICTMKIFLSLIFLVPAFAGQFTCPLSASDEPACLKAEDDDGKHCAWCSLKGFGFCLNEASAAAMEKSIPGTQCDHANGNDDAAPKEDDKVKPEPATDDKAPPATDDASPDGLWSCLQKKDLTDCTSASCTWCDSQAGFGLCMTGDAAASANSSHFFTQCTGPSSTSSELLPITLDNPYDQSCITGALNETAEFIYDMVSLTTLPRIALCSLFEGPDRAGLHHCCRFHGRRLRVVQLGRNVQYLLDERAS